MTGGSRRCWPRPGTWRLSRSMTPLELLDLLMSAELAPGAIRELRDPDAPDEDDE
jgi:hypothetical protein